MMVGWEGGEIVREKNGYYGYGKVGPWCRERNEYEGGYEGWKE